MWVHGLEQRGAPGTRLGSTYINLGSSGQALSSFCTYLGRRWPPSKCFLPYTIYDSCDDYQCRFEDGDCGTSGQKDHSLKVWGSGSAPVFSCFSERTICFFGEGPSAPSALRTWLYVHVENNRNLPDSVFLAKSTIREASLSGYPDRKPKQRLFSSGDTPFLLCRQQHVNRTSK